MTCWFKKLVRSFHGFRNGIHVELFMTWDIADVFNVRDADRVFGFLCWDLEIMLLYYLGILSQTCE